MDAAKSRGMATASMVLGIIGLALGLVGTFCVISIILIILGIVLYFNTIILGFLGFIFGLVSTIKKEGGRAIAGLIMSSLIVVLPIIGLVLSFASLGAQAA